ncbi:hypothetical protein L1987_64268 [Smallanthus sonchifolius]|uniref:Uncharacterized protein n=1 Tax=Smallanthus sonchifolius TaxID=185202 RepID=A0ACB9CFH9_9ASTR|nr:hypothetical protein L1987_64268 [Smallanthus sonchifolius]
MKLLNHEMGNLLVQEYTDKFKVLEQLMPQEISPGLIHTRFVQGLAPQTGEGQEDERKKGSRTKGDLHFAQDVAITMREGVSHVVVLNVARSDTELRIASQLTLSYQHSMNVEN